MESKQLAIIVEQSGVEKTQAQTVLDSFSNFFEQASEWETKTKGLVITNISQTKEMAMAREGRLQLKEIRVNAEKTKKRLKEDILIKGRFIDAIYNLIEGVTKPIEADLLEKEKFVERIEQARKDELRKVRQEELDKYQTTLHVADLEHLTEDEFSVLLKNARIIFLAREEEERKAREEAEAQAAAEEARRQAMAEENARLKAEAEAMEKANLAERAKVEAERIAREQKEKAERDEQQARIRIAEEKASSARKLLQDKIDADNKAKAEADAMAAKAKAEQIAREKAEQIAKEKAERELAKAGDRGRILVYIGQLEAIQLPSVKSAEAQAIIDSMVSAIASGKASGARL